MVVVVGRSLRDEVRRLGGILQVYSFPPLSRHDSKVLILGSMPGKASLRAQQYYAYPRNAFWSIMQALFGIDPALPYERRCRELTRCGVAVWDVLQTCLRTSSLDSDIDPSSIVPNDFQAFFDRRPGIRAVFFNGAMAEQTYLRHVRPRLSGASADLPLHRLPSTSPAHASLRMQQKIVRWQVILRALERHA